MIYIIGKSIGTFGGGAFVAMDLIDTLLSSGKRVGVISNNYTISERFSESFESVEWAKMPFIPQKGNYTNNSLGSIRYFLKRAQGSFDSFKLKKQIRKSPPSLMIFNDALHHTNEIKYKFGKLSKSVQIIHISPSFIEDFGPDDSITDFIKAYEKSDALVYVSDECRKKWGNFDPLKNKKTYYIPNCANEELANRCLNSSKEDVRSKLGMDPNKFYLLSVASFQPRKGQDLLIKAAPALKKIAPNLEILFIGALRQEYAHNLKRQVEQNGLDYTNFLGRKQNAMEYIYASDSFILTSKAEAFPLVILESMILKTPVLSSNVDGVPEMITNDENGYLFESANTEDLIQRFKEMYSNKKKRELFSERASEKYWNNFSKARFTERYLKMVDDMIT